VGDFSDAAGEREMAPKCGSLAGRCGRLGRSVIHRCITVHGTPSGL